MPFSRIVAPTAGRPGNSVAPHFVANHDHGALLRVIHVVEPPPFIDAEVADLVEIGGHSHDLAAGLKVVADRTNIVAGNDWSRRPYAWAFGRMSVIAIGQIVLP